MQERQEEESREEWSYTRFKKFQLTNKVPTYIRNIPVTWKEHHDIIGKKGDTKDLKIADLLVSFWQPTMIFTKPGGEKWRNKIYWLDGGSFKEKQMT